MSTKVRVNLREMYPKYYNQDCFVVNENVLLKELISFIELTIKYLPEKKNVY